LLREDSDHQSYQIVRGAQPTLPVTVFAYALAVYLECRTTSGPTVGTNELAYGAGSPGRVFGLSESGLIERLEALEMVTDGALVYDETAGLKQIFLRKAFESRTLLEQHYASRKGAAWGAMPRAKKH
jgi:Protein of unknown function (DUF4007)